MIYLGRYIQQGLHLEIYLAIHKTAFFYFGTKVPKNPGLSACATKIHCRFFLTSGLERLAAWQPIKYNALDPSENLVSTAIEACYYFFSNQFALLADSHISAPEQLFALAQRDKIPFSGYQLKVGQSEVIPFDKRTVKPSNLSRLKLVADLCFNEQVTRRINHDG